MLIPDFAFRTATPFVDVPAGVDIELAVAPGNSMSAADAIYTMTANLADGGTYIIVASGIVSPTGYSPTQPFALAIYPMGREAASMTGNTDVLVFHGATDAPVIDVTLTSGATLVDNIAYSNYASNGYLELPTADYEIQVRDAAGVNVVASYAAPLAALGLQNNALVVLASGFLDPTMNSNGASFGLYAALASGGNLVALPSFTGVDGAIAETALALYPNPAKNTIRVSHNGLSNGLVELTDAVGRVLLRQNLTVDETVLDVTALSDGIYSVRVEAPNAAVSTGRIMVSNR
ncbi:MAG TPA: T9SS type A sorting domain-containing protein, partial [Chitinophagales bacterium]|nr:T9SS type A sorting domain-containing protein [Chitinophagales bacterium]